MGRRGRPPAEVWQEVPVRGRRGDDQRQKKQDDERVTKFFVANLPKGCSSADVSEVLKDFGDIKGVYVARKLDKFGNRFCFVSFRGSLNGLEMEKRMVNVKLGNNRLFIKTAKFVDGNNMFEDNRARQDYHAHKDKGREESNQATRKGGAGGSNDRGGRSFSDVLTNKYPPKVVKCVKVQDNAQAFTDWYDVAAVGRIKDFTTLTTLRNLMRGAGLCGFSIKYVGGFNVGLVFEDSGALTDFLNKKEVWGQWFDTLDRWSGQTVAFERIAWVKVHGVPLHLTLAPVFNVIGGLFGKVVQPAQISDDDNDLSYVCLGIIRGDGIRINEEVDLMWKNRKIRIWVEEEMSEWIPDCLEDGWCSDDEEEEDCSVSDGVHAVEEGSGNKRSGEDQSGDNQRSGQEY